MSTPTRKRLLRFSLRTMLVVVTVLCVVPAWKIRQAERQKAAAVWVEKMGGEVHYDYEFDEKGANLGPYDYDSSNRFADPRRPGPDWLCALIGLDYFAKVVRVDLSGEDSSRGVRSLSPLIHLTSLESLDLSTVQVPDEEVARFLKSLPSCEVQRSPFGW